MSKLFEFIQTSLFATVRLLQFLASGFVYCRCENY